MFHYVCIKLERNNKNNNVTTFHRHCTVSIRLNSSIYSYCTCEVINWNRRRDLFELEPVCSSVCLSARVHFELTTNNKLNVVFSAQNAHFNSNVLF